MGVRGGPGRGVVWVAVLRQREAGAEGLSNSDRVQVTVFILGCLRQSSGAGPSLI